MLFIDTSEIEAVRVWLARGVVDGLTLNPSIIRRAGIVDVDGLVKHLSELVHPRPVSVPAVGSSCAELVAAGRRLSALAENVVVKVPVVGSDGASNLEALHVLASDGIITNATACFTPGQAYLAGKAGAHYASLFWSRIAEEGADAGAATHEARGLIDADGLRTQVIVGSVRRTDDITRALLAGAHVVTVPPRVLDRWGDHHYSRLTCAEFERADAERQSIPPAIGSALGCSEGE